jgi:SAM-dependent methyltransferase
MSLPAENPELWRPVGDYPGDRAYVGWFIAGVLLLLAAAVSVLPGGFFVFAMLGSGALAIGTGIVGLMNARTRRFQLWGRVAAELAPADGQRVLDIGSIDMIGAAALAHVNPEIVIAAVPDGRDADRVQHNLTALRAALPADEIEADHLGELPLGDASYDVIVSDSSKALLKRAKLDAALAEIVRVAAPGAQVAIVIGARTRRIRAALEAAGATDISIEKVLGTNWTGYRLVRARFPETA